MPFAGYKDFDECVRRNSDKGDPKAYCGKIQHAVEAYELEMNPPELQQFNAVEQLGEVFIDGWEETDDGIRAKIRIIKAGLSKNNRNYRVTALKKAAKEGIFDNLKMFRGHSKDLPLKRRDDEFVAFTSDTAFEEDTSSLVGFANFVDEKFAKKVKAAKGHIGVSIDSLLSGFRIPQAGGRALEDITAFVQPRSVDFVLFPAAGGEILAWESEGETEVDWAAVEAELATLGEDDLKKNLPSFWAKWHPETRGQPPIGGSSREAEEDDEDNETDEDEEPTQYKKGKKKTRKAAMVRREEVAEIVADALKADREARQEEDEKKESAAAQVREAFANAGLPDKTRARVMAAFEGVTEYDDEKVKKAITDAKEELKAAGAGPQITDMGPSSSGGTDKAEKKVFRAHESARSAFVRTAPSKSGDKKEE